MLNIEQTQKILDRFRLHVVKEAKKNLTNKQKNASKGLYNSIAGNVKAMPNSISIEFVMQQYGAFQDKGVKGANPAQVSKNAKIRGQQAPNSPYKFKTKRPPSKPLEEWAKKKGLRLRDDKGKFKEGSYKTIGIVLAKNIWARGIKPSLFFTKPFEAAFRNLPEETIQAFALDVEELMSKTILIK